MSSYQEVEGLNLTFFKQIFILNTFSASLNVYKERRELKGFEEIAKIRFVLFLLFF